jgi:hypothetical protein
MNSGRSPWGSSSCTPAPPCNASSSATLESSCPDPPNGTNRVESSFSAGSNRSTLRSSSWVAAESGSSNSTASVK